MWRYLLEITIVTFIEFDIWPALATTPAKALGASALLLGILYKTKINKIIWFFIVVFFKLKSTNYYFYLMTLAFIFLHHFHFSFNLNIIFLIIFCGKLFYFFTLINLSIYSKTRSRFLFIYKLKIIKSRLNGFFKTGWVAPTILISSVLSSFSVLNRKIPPMNTYK